MRKRYTGSYRKTPSGAYEICMSCGFDNDNNRKRLYKIVYVETDKEAEMELKEFINENLEQCVNEKSKFYHKIKNN